MLLGYSSHQQTVTWSIQPGSRNERESLFGETACDSSTATQTETACFGHFVSSISSLSLLVVSAEEHSVLGCHGYRITLPFIGSRSDSHFRQRGYFERHIVFSSG